MKKNEVRKKIVKQMKMNGYAEVEEKDPSTIFAYKVNVPGLLFERSGMMIMIDYSALSFYGFYDINNRSIKENLDFISYINDLNKTALTTRLASASPMMNEALFNSLLLSFLWFS